jgi:hypothetical protein
MKFKDRFAACTVPEIGDFRGEYAVKLVAPLLPGIRFFGHFKSVPEDFEKSKGFNCFLRLVKIGAFRMERGPSILDGQEVVKILYDGPGNPPLLGRLIDEVRQECPGFYFCRGVTEVFGKPVIIMYFTMEKL